MILRELKTESYRDEAEEKQNLKFIPPSLKKRNSCLLIKFKFFVVGHNVQVMLSPMQFFVWTWLDAI